MPDQSKFHRGELEVQLRSGEESIAQKHAPLILDTIVDGAMPFLEIQFMAVLSSIDIDGAVWASILYGQPGFIYAEGNTTVCINVRVEDRDLSDPFWTNILHDKHVGMLFIDLGSRRRYRINGEIQANSNEGIRVTVSEAYPNCPRYIQRRQLRTTGDGPQAYCFSTGNVISEDIAGLISTTDTLFVGSVNAQTGADISHRGGANGFVQIMNCHTFRIPDFNGNSLFNTFGNFEINPNAGICIPDFEGQKILQFTGQAMILWDQDDPQNLTGGTKRFWEFEVEHWILRHIPKHLEWELLDASPFIPTKNGP